MTEKTRHENGEASYREESKLSAAEKFDTLLEEKTKKRG